MFILVIFKQCGLLLNLALLSTHRSSHTCTNRSEERQLDNPVYDASMVAPNYSSSGPTYELVDTNEGAGQTYSAPEQSQESRPKPAKTTTEDEEHYYHILDTGEQEVVTEGGDNYKGSVSEQTNSRVKLCGEEYSTLR